ncbi:MAG: efflux RND transporter periplasmic adaptor subunit [Rhodospirillales bacterium]|nr:efflux RND transporter periplasmic adaptor subunit [Rhodospirillales bacterium]
MQRHTLFRILVLAAAGGLLTGPAGSQSPSGEFTAKLGAVEDLKAVFATVESVRVASARTRIGGTISELLVTEGTLVERGERIALVTDPKLRLQIEALESRIQSLEAQRANAKAVFDRVRELWQNGTVAKARYDEAETNLNVATRQLSAMKSERDVVSQQQVEGAVLAPSEGRVLKVNVTKGTNVQAGDVVATLTAEAYILRMQLPERHARYIQEGQGVLVGHRGLGATAVQSAGHAQTGRIRQVYPEMDQGRVVADVEVEGLGNYFVGERVPVYVSAGTRQTFVVPADLLFLRYGVTYARLKGVGDTVVQVGQPIEGNVEVLSGLRDGDVLIRPEAAR